MLENGCNWIPSYGGSREAHEISSGLHTHAVTVLKHLESRGDTRVKKETSKKGEEAGEERQGVRWYGQSSWHPWRNHLYEPSMLCNACMLRNFSEYSYRAEDWRWHQRVIEDIGVWKALVAPALSWWEGQTCQRDSALWILRCRY